LGQVLGVRIGHEAQRVRAQCELGVAEQGALGGDDEATGHLEDRVGGAGADARGQFEGARFEFGREWFGHDDLRRSKFATILKTTPN
jgi:hypothetical protein